MTGRTDALVEALKTLCAGEPRLTVAVAESLTCGQLQAAIGAVSGVSAFFLGGITAYAVEQKVRHLGVDPAEALPCQGVSPAVARQMAAGACRLFAADVAVATTGFAEPNPALGCTEPTAYFAVACRSAESGRDGPVVKREGQVVRPGVTRREMQADVVLAALEALRDVVEALRTQKGFTRCGR